MVAFLSPDMLPSTYHFRGLTGALSSSSRQMASVAMVTMFCPAASPVVNSRIRCTILPLMVLFTSISRQCFDVRETIPCRESTRSSIQDRKRPASIMFAKSKHGARDTASVRQNTAAPPAWLTTAAPRL
jgi:hypothetical protein